MWGESSDLCEINCQCSGLLSDFRINSGSGATKRKQEASSTNNFKLKMNPHSIDFNKSPLSPIHTPKRRIFGEIQNFKPLGEHQNYNQLQNFKPTSPYIERLKPSPLSDYNKSPKTHKSPLSTSQKENIPCNLNSATNRPQKSPVFTNTSAFNTQNKQKTPNSPIFGVKTLKSQNLPGFGTEKLTQSLGTKGSPLASIKSPLLNSPIISTHSPLTTNTTRLKRTSKITRIFEERTKFKMDNKENLSETFMKFDFEEEARDCSFSSSGFQKKTWTSAKLDFTDTLPQKHDPCTVPQPDSDIDDMSLQDLEAEFDNEHFDTCTNYEIISTDSPDIISRGRSSNRKVTARSFNFGAPISDNEASTSFNEPSNYKATRVLNFDDEHFEFTSPAAKKSLSVKKSLKFNETPTKADKATKLNDTSNNTLTSFAETSSNTFQYTESSTKSTKYNETFRSLKFNKTPSKAESSKFTSYKTLTSFAESSSNTSQYTETSSYSMKYTESTKSTLKSLKFNETPTKLCHQRSDSSIGSMSSPASSQNSYRVKLYTSESTASMESGFISELEEPFLDIEDSNSPKVANFSELLSGQIKDNIFTDKNFMKRPSLARSLSFHPESKAKVSLLSILEGNEEKRGSKRTESKGDEEGEKDRVKRRKNCVSPVKRPVLQRAFSENNASIMSALARSAIDPDLIGDFSSSFSLPLTPGDHTDLKSITCDTLAGLLSGEYRDTVTNFQVIDCRYPYEYSGGHIINAVNLYTQEQILEFVNNTPKKQREVLILHCEFSIERGPQLFRYLRSSDRAKNSHRYPNLDYPEMYLLESGYRAFYLRYPHLCTPEGYTAMLDPRHRQLLRRHRSHQIKRY